MTPRHIAVLKGQSFVSFDNCFISGWGRLDEKAPAIVAESGRLQVRGCSFAGARPAVRIGAGVKHAIVADNNGDHGVTVINEAADRAVLRDNEPGA